MLTVIRNGTIVNSDEMFSADIAIENEKIISIGDIETSGEDNIIDASGKYIFPGMIDAHTHLDLDTGATKTADDFESGTKAAIAGGTTTIIDFATQEKGKSLQEALNNWHEKAKDRAFCDYGFHMAIVDWNEKIKNEMGIMIDKGVSSFKMYMAYKGSLQVDDMAIFEALLTSKNLKALIGFHCENGDLVSSMTKKLLSEAKTSPYYHAVSRPDIVEEEAIFRLCEIAALAAAPIWVVHLSTEKGLKIINNMKKCGINIFTETCPQYLTLDDSCYGKADDTSFEGAKYVMSPPLRKKSDSLALWQGLKDGSVDIISTDHCSFNFKGQKELGLNDFSKIPNGASGLEHRLNLLYTYGVCENRLSLTELVKNLSYNPSRIFGLTEKGKIQKGFDADIVIFDPNGKFKISKETQIQKADYTPYEGFTVSGKVERVILRGKEIFSDGKFEKASPTGKFQKRSTFL